MIKLFTVVVSLALAGSLAGTAKNNVQVDSASVEQEATVESNVMADFDGFIGVSH